MGFHSTPTVAQEDRWKFVIFRAVFWVEDVSRESRAVTEDIDCALFDSRWILRGCGYGCRGRERQADDGNQMV